MQVNGYEGDRAGHLKEMFCFDNGNTSGILISVGWDELE